MVLKQTQVNPALISLDLPPSSLLTFNILGLFAAVSPASCWKSEAATWCIVGDVVCDQCQSGFNASWTFQGHRSCIQKMDFQFDTGRSRRALPYADTHSGSADVCRTLSLFLNDCLLSSADAGSGSGDDGKITRLLPVPPPLPLPPLPLCAAFQRLCLHPSPSSAETSSKRRCLF